MPEEFIENTENEDVEGGEIGLELDKNNTEADEEVKSQEDKEALEKDKEVEKAPEEYDFSKVEMPEGMNLDKDLTSEFSKVAKEMNLSQANADKMIALGVKLATKSNEALTSALKQFQEEQIKAYSTMLNTDEEIGGAKLKQSLSEANIAYNQFVSAEASELLAQTGLNKHPAIVKVFMKIGKELKEDSIRKTGDSRKERTASDWYPNMA